MTPSQPTAHSFRAWVRSSSRVTLAASCASVVGAFVLAATLGAAHSVIYRNQPGDWISWGPIHVDRPDSTVAILVMAALLLTLSSVVQSLLRSFDAIVVRHRLRRFAAQQQAAGVFSARSLMAERYLLEGWTRFVSGLVQAAAYSVLLIRVAGASQILGLAGVAVIAVSVGVSFFRRARSASIDFLTAQHRATAAEQQRRRTRGAGAGDGDEDGDGDLHTLMLGVSDAVYRRDTQAFRLSASRMAVLSTGAVACVVIPAFLTLGDDQLTLFLISLFIWRSRVIEAVSSVGHFTWTLCLWRDAGSAAELVDSVVGDEADVFDID